jgi:hypothetical protein
MFFFNRHREPKAKGAALPDGVKVAATQDPKLRQWLAGQDITASGGRNLARRTPASK